MIFTARDKEEALFNLKIHLKPGDTLYGVCKSPKVMTRTPPMKFTLYVANRQYKGQGEESPINSLTMWVGLVLNSLVAAKNSDFTWLCEARLAMSPQSGLDNICEDLWVRLFNGGKTLTGRLL